MKTLLYALPAALLLFTGCAQKKSEVYADFLMPPKEITNINDVKDIKINIKNIQINGLSKKANKDISNLVKGKLSALVYKENFLNVSDDTLGKNFTKASKNYHGYGKFYQDKPNYSILDVDLKVNVKKTSGTEKVTTKLEYQRYTTKYVGKKFPRPVGVPSGSPTITTATNNVPFVNYVVTADMNIKLTNGTKKVVYTKTFANLKLTKKIGGNSKVVTELPTDLSIVSELLTNKLRDIVYDLSPHTVSRKLVVNESGDASVVALMKATAFSDAADKLDGVITKQETDIEIKIKELTVKYDTDIKKAKDQKAKDSLTASHKSKIKGLYKPVAADYENMGVLNEILGDMEMASYFYEESKKADSSNSRLEISLNRIKDTVEKQKTLKTMSVKKKSTYKNKDNKDR